MDCLAENGVGISGHELEGRFEQALRGFQIPYLVGERRGTRQSVRNRYLVRHRLRARDGLLQVKTASLEISGLGQNPAGYPIGFATQSIVDLLRSSFQMC